MSRTYRTSRRTFSRVTDSRTPRSPGYRSYQGRRGEVRLDSPLDRGAKAKRSYSKAVRRGDRVVVRSEMDELARR